MHMKYAVIDIGSNSVRLMLWADGPLYKSICTTRLAEGLAHSGVLSQDAMERTCRAVLSFAREGERVGARVLAFATAAVRSAANGAAFCKMLLERGVAVDVISGEREAELGLLGALGGAPGGGIVDLGGASTEICVRAEGKTAFSVSLPVGAVRLLDRCGQDAALLRRAVDEATAAVARMTVPGKLYAIGGTASTLACMRLALPAYDASRLNGAGLPADWLHDTAERLLLLGVEERKAIAGMDARRADVIAGATLLLASIADRLGCESLYFSDADNLEGYLIARGLA